MHENVDTAFVAHLERLAQADRGAMATLRRSLSFDPGAFPSAYPYVEPFVANLAAGDNARVARYLVAGLFAQLPLHVPGCSPGRAMRTLSRARGREQGGAPDPAIERRLIGLLDADRDQLAHGLRQIGSLLAQHGIGLDYARLAADLRQWSSPQRYVQQRWARDFYAFQDAGADSEPANA